MIDAMRDRLTDDDVGASDGAQFVAQCGQHGGLATLAGTQTNLYLGGIDSLGMRVTLGATSAPRRGDYLWRIQQQLLDTQTDGVGFFQRGARQGNDTDRQAAFVEFRKESAAGD